MAVNIENVQLLFICFFFCTKTTRQVSDTKEHAITGHFMNKYCE